MGDGPQRDMSKRTMEPTTELSTPPLASPSELSELPPIADLASREMRRMGRAWKIEATKSALHIVITILVVAVLGAGLLLVLCVLAVAGWYLWSKFSVKATIKPYRRRGSKSSSDAGAAENVGEEYSEWLLGSMTASDAGLADIRSEQ